MSGLIDSFGRPHTHLRISVTDRCNLRCTYCMPEDVQFLDKSELLSYEEIAELAAVAVELGIDKFRLTGGEPLLRRDLASLVARLVAIPGLRDLGLTTNGVLLGAQAQPLFDAGLRRLNVSLDTLDRGRFAELARRDALPMVLDGLRAAKRAGFAPIKVNAVALRGFIEHDAVELAQFCRGEGFELRFIESMPIGAQPWDRGRAVLAHELLEWIEAGIGPLVPASDYDPHAPAMDFDYADGGGRIGIIASVSRPFCNRCNRLRVTAEGKLRNCLFALDEIDVKPHLRGGDRAGLIAAFQQSVGQKAAGHEFNAATFVKPLRTMHTIGG